MPSVKIKSRSVPSAQPLADHNRVLSSILRARGINDATELDYGLNRLLPPTDLSHITDAAEMLSEAIQAQASIVIVGDFDADGATSCALAVRCLRAFGLHNVSYLVPNRFEFGYGLTPEIVGVAAIRQPDLLITVDNGISSIDGVHAAQALGMSVLITDHHLPGDTLPTADVIVNPNLPGDRFASKNLAGVGVIFYVMLATRAKLRDLGWFAQTGIAEPKMTTFLDLVALGTVADVVPLDRNNRVLVHQGLQRMRQGGACAGIQALLSVAGRSPHRLVASDLGFAVAPRLNAAGRMEDMSLGIECLLSDDVDAAMTMATQLDEINQLRRTTEAGMQEEALSIVDDLALQQEQPLVYCLADESWHEGVVGLVASRIKERTHRPVIAMAPAGDGTEWKGSARSIRGVHIRDLLARLDALYPGLMLRFGGHAMAAGLSLKQQKRDEFSRALAAVADELMAGQDWDHIVWTDGELLEEEFSLELAEQIRDCSPWGQAFPEPLFDGQFEVLDARLVGEKHAKLRLRPIQGTINIDAICFSWLDQNADLPAGQVRAVYRLDANEFRQRTKLQMIIEHLQVLQAE